LLPEKTSVGEFLYGIGVRRRGKRADGRIIFDGAPHRVKPRYHFEGVRLLDPFAGFGSIPLEGLRLGLDVTAVELLPVAYVFLKAVLEYPAKYGERLVRDVERWGQWVTERLKEDPLIRELYEDDVAVYIGSWEVKCPHCGRWTPLVGNWWLARVKADEGYARLAWMEPAVDGDEVKIRVVDLNKVLGDKAVKEARVSGLRITAGGKEFRVPESNIEARREKAVCLLCHQPIMQIDPQTGRHYAETKDITTLPPSVALTKEERKKKFVKVTEAKSIKTYLEKDEVGLQELVRSIIAAKQEIEREISSKGVLYKPRTRREVEESVKLTGFENHKEIFNALNELLKASAPILGLNLLDEGEAIKIWKGLEMPTYINTLDGFYANLTQKSSVDEAVCIVAQGDSEALISLIPISIKDRRDGSLLYADIIGVDTAHGKIFRGSSLLKIMSQAIAKCLGAEKLNAESREMPVSIYANIIDEIKGITEILNIADVYKSRLENYGLRDHEKVWIKNSDIEVAMSNAVGYLHFVKISLKPLEDIPEDVKKEIEKQAVEKVLTDERAEGRIPFLVPETEHYDVKSVNPSTGEIRLIEVKGHKGLEIYAELTEDEAKVAAKEKERYWLYIIYDIGSGQPKALRFQNPLETMDLQVFERIQKRYILRPKT